MKEFDNIEDLVEASLLVNCRFLGSAYANLSEEEKENTNKVERIMIRQHQMYYSSLYKGYVVDSIGFVTSK